MGLGAATVKATKVKFYMKGDTVVYNADAFQLENGSMLDAIIRQLPGVELKDGGEITVNGKKVDELLLNGKDFFSHDRQIMLENLPAYMVKDIKVYERQSERSKFFKDSLLDIKKPYVMDVNLKREYSIGYTFQTNHELRVQKGVFFTFSLRFLTKTIATTALPLPLLLVSGVTATGVRLSTAYSLPLPATV